ncbi:hypothetical protein O3M35_012718 [Rhynocoris fuscipes]|uniref:Reverse transcriptase domain-containing protein n=1 Tax=Rhynocoris fuscipes TaxID=488301 RepID=A0AAW1CUT8_9HEMI
MFIYFNDFSQVLPESCIQFTDDTIIISKAIDKDTAEKKLADNLEIAKEWLESNGMILNENKTCTKMFTINKKYSQEHFTFLGITLDTRLGWKDHINALAAKLSTVIYLLRRLVKEVDRNAVLRSNFSYGIVLWDATPHAKNCQLLIWQDYTMVWCSCNLCGSGCEESMAVSSA